MDLTRRAILCEESQIGPYPLEKLPRVDKITTQVHDETLRPVQAENELNKCMRGDYGEAVAVKARGLTVNNPLCEAIFALVPHLCAFPENPVAAQKAPLPEAHLLSRHIKKYTYFLGADQVGICRVPKRTIYQDDAKGQPLECDYQYAVVFLMRKDPDTIAASHGDEWVDGPASWICYQRLAVISVTLARYIRSLGYPAKASHMFNYSTLLPRLVVEAGLGEFSRMGIAVNPFYGATFKAACVLCDLPLEPDKPIDFGLQDYCAKCGICAQQCPVGAIPAGDKVEYNGYTTWVHERKKCALYCVNHPHGDICQRCTKVCPFNRPDGTPEQFKDWDGNLDYLYRLVEEQRARMEACGYEAPAEKTGKWWLPLRQGQGGVQEVGEFDYNFHYRRQERMSEADSETMK